MSAYHEQVVVHEKEDAQGNITTDTTRTTKAIIKREEPDYIKLYTRMWCEFNDVNPKYRRLFLALILRMSYANLAKGDAPEVGGQIVYVIGPARKEIMAECGWEKDDALCKGLRSLVDCNAIRKISRGVYQINPHYAGRGKWRYDARENQGGIENLVAAFDFRNKTVTTSITWASGDPAVIGDGLDQVVATHTEIIDKADDKTDGDVPF